MDKRIAGTRMVMLTSLGMRGDARRFQEIGFTGYATKPVRHRELKAVLSLALRDRDEAASMPQSIATRHAARETLNPLAGRRARILLAEDNITNQQVALGILKKLGLRADAVADGVEALKALKTLPYDLVLMDVQMPEMDGIEATKRIRAHEFGRLNEKDEFHSSFIIRNSSLPIIAMTAHAMQGDRERCLAAGMNDYIAKPVSTQALAEALNKWLPKENDESGMMNDEQIKMNMEYSMMKKNEPAADDTHSSFVIHDSSLIFDRAGMMDRLMDDEHLAHELVKGFLKDVPKQIAKLKDYLGTTDVSGVERQAHTIRGASANVGGEALMAVALEMEMAGKSGDLGAVKARMAEMEAQFDRLTQAITNDL
ncbi:MAG: response regulator [Pseudomonadota bacterium]